MNVEEEEELVRQFARDKGFYREPIEGYVFSPYPRGLVRFGMLYCEVDGVERYRIQDPNSFAMFSLKMEFNDKDEPWDTGGAWEYYAHVKASEKHWLGCGVVVRVGGYCVICEEKVKE